MNNSKLLRMYKIIFVLLIVLLSSCRKDVEKGLGIVTGKTDDLIVTEHDTIVNADYDGIFNEVWCKIDLDNDGVFDLRFVSFENDLTYPDSAIYYKVWVQINNDQVNVLEVPESGKQFELITTSYDFYGTFPRKTYLHQITCDSLPGTKLYNGSKVNSALCLKKEILLGNNLDWTNSLQEINLIRESYANGQYEFNLAGDSLIGDIFSREALCTSAPVDEIFYLAFRINKGFKAKYGWIELKITDHNSIHILRSAISKDM